MTSTPLTVTLLHENPPLHAHRIDDATAVVVLELLSADVVLLQACLELYEGVATMRTIIPKESVVALFTPVSMLPNTRDMLVSLHGQIAWRSREHLGEKALAALMS